MAIGTKSSPLRTSPHAGSSPLMAVQDGSGAALADPLEPILHQMSAFSSIDLFYDLDERRRRSREIDYGVWWRWHDELYRVSWVEATGELIAARRSAPSVRRVDATPEVMVVELVNGDPPATPRFAAEGS